MSSKYSNQFQKQFLKWQLFSSLILFLCAWKTCERNWRTNHKRIQNIFEQQNFINLKGIKGKTWNNYSILCNSKNICCVFRINKSFKYISPLLKTFLERLSTVGHRRIYSEIIELDFIKIIKKIWLAYWVCLIWWDFEKFINAKTLFRILFSFCHTTDRKFEEIEKYNFINSKNNQIKSPSKSVLRLKIKFRKMQAFNKLL